METKFIKVDLPQYLVGENLYSSINIEKKTNSHYSDVTINGKKWSLIKLSSDDHTIFFNWNNVVFFDSAAILQLLVIQFILLDNHINVTHFPAPNSKPRAKSATTIAKKINCRKITLGHLDTIGYISIWVSGLFGSSNEEAFHLLNNNPISIEQRINQKDVMPIVPCISELSLSQGSIENQQISRFERHASISTFISKQKHKMHQRNLIASGDFNNLILRQCRKNVIDHAKPLNIALSMAQIVNKQDFLNQWVLSYDQWKKIPETTFSRVINEMSDDTPILDLITIDDGEGIINTLASTWDDFTLKRPEVCNRVRDALPPDSSPNHQILSFALDPDGRRMSTEVKSSEDSGLTQISDFVSKDGGLLELNSGNIRIVKSTSSIYEPSNPNTPLPIGTLIRLVLPLNESEINKSDRVYHKSFKSSEPYVNRWSSQILYEISLYRMWKDILEKNDPVQLNRTAPEYPSTRRMEIKTDISTPKKSTRSNIDILVFNLICRLEDIKNDFFDRNKRAFILDWDGLPWDDHEASLFFEKIYDRILANDLATLPIVHINVPEEQLFNSKSGVSKYSDYPPKPTCVFIDGKTEWCWLGLSVPTEHRVLERNVQPRTQYNILGSLKSADEIYLEMVFNDLLNYKRIIKTYNHGHEAWRLAYDYLKHSSFFNEISMSSAYSVRKENIPRFEPLVGLPILKQAVKNTFRAKLKIALTSNYCMFPPKASEILEEKKDRSIKKKKKELIRLPSGRIVDKYYRCEGLLDYIPTKGNEFKEVGDVNANLKFKDELSVHLVDAARDFERISNIRFDLIVSCTSPTYWFVRHIADGLSDDQHYCDIFIAKRHLTFRSEFFESDYREGTKILVFTDVISTGRLIDLIFSTLSSKGLQVYGFLSLASTKIDAKVILNKYLDRSKYKILTYLDVDNSCEGKPSWWIDPETLEPKKLHKPKDLHSILSGIGSIALKGEQVQNWLLKFSALKHNHFVHGGHHSSITCDVIELFNQREVRTTIGGRLNLYIRTNGIDLIVFPNQSCAYMLVDILREIAGIEKTIPPIQSALGRWLHNELSYTLSYNSPNIDPSHVMIIDDGIVTAKTVRSIINSVLSRYKNVKEIHIVVFSNEMLPTHSNYWSTISARNPVSMINKKRGRKAFLNLKLNFSSFLSLPHISYTEDNCPLCNKYLKFKFLSNNEHLTCYEREFYRIWAREISPKKSIHSMTTQFQFQKAKRKENLFNFGESRESLAILYFENSIGEGLSIQNTIEKTINSDYNIYYKIYCLSRLLEFRGTLLSESEYENAWREMIQFLISPNTNRSHKLLTLKSIIHAQIKPPSIKRFSDIVTATANSLNDSLILGAVMAFARLSFKSNQYESSWDKHRLDRDFQTISKWVSNEECKSQLNLLLNWLKGDRSDRLSACAVFLKKATSPIRLHYNAENDISILTGKLLEAWRNFDVESDNLRNISIVSIRLIDLFSAFNKIAKIFLRYDLSYNTLKLEEIIKKTSYDIDGILPLININSSLSRSKIRNIIYSASNHLSRLSSSWFNYQKGYARQLLDPFLLNLYDSILEAIDACRSKYKAKWSPSIIRINLSNIERLRDINLFVLCKNSVLHDTLFNIISNVWMHAIPPNTQQQLPITIDWSYEMKEGRIVIIAKDDGIGANHDNDYFIDQHGFSINKAFIEEFDGNLSISKGIPSGTEVRLELQSKRRNSNVN